MSEETDKMIEKLDRLEAAARGESPAAYWETMEARIQFHAELGIAYPALREALLAAREEAGRLREEARWILVEERLPETRQRVNVFVQPKYGKPYRTMADYIAPRTVLADDYLSEDCGLDFSDYDEEKDCYWTPGGWFEYQHEADMNYYIEGTVTHWRPLPEPPALTPAGSVTELPPAGEEEP